MSLFDALTGRFADGTPYEAVSKEKRHIKSIESALVRIFKIRKGSDAQRPLLGVGDSGEICAMLQKNRTALENELRAMIKMYEPRISQVTFFGWEYEPDTGVSTCLVIAALADFKTRIPLKFTFHYTVGGNNVEIATTQNTSERDVPRDNTEDFLDD